MKKLTIMPVILKSVARGTLLLFVSLAFSSFLSAAAPECTGADLKAASDYSEWFQIHQMCNNDKDVSVINSYLDRLNLSKSDLALHLNRRDESGHSALDYAIMSGDSLKVMLLLDNGANPIPCFITALAPWFRKEIAETLAARCFVVSFFDISYQGFSLVHRVAQFNRSGQSLVFIIDELLKRKIPPVESFNFASSSGMTPLHCAAVAGMLSNVRTLVENGARINARDYIGDTPLHLAAKAGHVEVVKALIRCGADADADNCYKQTPMSYARIYDRQDVIDILQGYSAQQSTHQSESDSEDDESAEAIENLFASFDIKLQRSPLCADENMCLVKNEDVENDEKVGAVFENKHLSTSSEIKKQPILGGIDVVGYLSDDDDESFALKSFHSEEMCASSDSESSDGLERLFISFERQGTCAVSE